MLDGEEFPRAAHSALNLVGDKQDAVLITQRAESGQKIGGWYVIAPFALDRLDEDRGNFVWRADAAEHSFFDAGDESLARVRIGARFRAFGIGNMVNIRHQRRKAAPMHHLGAGKRHSSIRPAVESS